MNHRVEVYSAAYCGYCLRAKQLLERKGIKYIEIPIDLDANKRTEMIDRTGRRTVPQIIIDDQAIGGFDDLWALDQSGQLDKILAN